jgi:hypothetical protein
MCGFAEGYDSRHIPGIVSDQYDVARFNRNIRPRSDCDTDIRCQQRRGVVHSVANHPAS